MSDSDETEIVDIVDVDIRRWVEAASANPPLYRDRQVTEVVLTTIGLAPNLKDALVLKGGALMALGFSSLRLTADVDFTALVGPDGFDDQLTADLNANLSKTAIEL